jgi:bromodomain adjacent to zinc finger domain protein 1A
MVDLLVEWASEKDVAAGRTELRPIPDKVVPFSDQFETFLMTWSFLNVMG